MINLEETCTLMLDDDYRERFKAEYWQTKIRYERLKSLNNKIEAANETMCLPTPDLRVSMPVHTCPEHLLRERQHAMGNYLRILEIRAVIEGIDLEDHHG